MSGPQGEDDDRAFASPPCFLHEAGDDYMGYLPREDLIPLLDELRGAARSLAESTAGIPADLRQEAARWCAMLVIHMTRLHAAPTPARQGNMAAAAARARIGAALPLVLPKVRCDDLHGDLAEMLRSYLALS
jgi:hypothetical protein